VKNAFIKNGSIAGSPLSKLRDENCSLVIADKGFYWIGPYFSTVDGGVAL
jgi:hypothetical protein